MYPTVSIENPLPQELVPVSQPLVVAGVAYGVGGAEPSLIESVTVSVGGGSPVAASIKRITSHGSSPPPVSFSATVPFPNAAGLVAVEVAAKDDMGVTGSASVTVIGHEVGAAASTPKESLEVFATNPAPPAGDWATQIVKAGRSSVADIPTIANLAITWKQGDQFPVCSREWTQ